MSFEPLSASFPISGSYSSESVSGATKKQKNQHSSLMSLSSRISHHGDFRNLGNEIIALIFSFIGLKRNGASCFFEVNKDFHNLSPYLISRLESFDFSDWDPQAVTAFTSKMPKCLKIEELTEEDLNDIDLFNLVTQCPKITSLDLSVPNNNVASSLKDISCVSKLRLTTLKIKNCHNIPRENFPLALARCNRLRVLNANSTTIDDQGLASLSSTIRKLDLFLCENVTNEGLCQLFPRMNQLKYLKSDDVNGDSLARLHPDLTYLNLLDNLNLGAADYLQIANFYQLRVLILSECENVNDGAIVAIPATVERLELGVLENSEISPEHLSVKLQELSLTLLDVENLEAFDDSCLEALCSTSAKARKLKKLIISGCTRVTVACLKRCLPRFTELEELKIAATNANDSILRAGLPHTLNSLNIRDCQFNDPNSYDALRHLINLGFLDATNLPSEKNRLLTQAVPNLRIRNYEFDNDSLIEDDEIA